MRAILIWAALGVALSLPIGVAATSPLLAWREPVYILGGMAGVVGLALMLAQPLLAGGYLPGLHAPLGRRAHVWVGGTLAVAVAVHVAGLWAASPPDVIDALLFRSPTPFAVWGVIAMWAVFASAIVARFRRRWRVPPRLWRLGHTALAMVIVTGTALHALLIEGAMGTVSKAALCAVVIAATVKAVVDLRVWVLLTRRRR